MVPPDTDQVPVKVFAGVLTVGAVVYSSSSVMRPSGSVRTARVTPPAGGTVVVRSPLYTVVVVDFATPLSSLVSTTTRPSPS